MATETPSVPMEAPEATTYLCTLCDKEIDGEWVGPDEFGPYEFIPGQHITSDGDQYIHDHCKLQKVANELDAEDRFRMARLVAAMCIISETPTGLLERMDRQDLFDFDLAGMKVTVDRQLDDLNDELGTFTKDDLVFVRSSALVEGSMALAGAISGAKADLVSLVGQTVPKYLFDIKSERLSFLAKVRGNLQEATHA